MITELSGETNDLAEPNFSSPIQNVTVALGREAVLTCSVTDLGPYKVNSCVFLFIGLVTVLRNWLIHKYIIEEVVIGS